MLTTPHVLTGLVVANKVTPLWVAAIGSVVSHQIIDLIPHDDFDLLGDERDGESKVILFKEGGLNINWRTLIVVLDAGIAGGLALYFGFRFGDPARYLLCGLLATWSDILRAPMFFLDWKPKFIKWVGKVEEILHTNEKSIWGKAVQIAVVIDMLAILFNAVEFPWL